ncbi:MAG: cardiolipin synthase [Oscillospiraceae bacterium]|nr:cardiolipin synthase [Oscillospiraceae bacterium]
MLLLALQMGGLFALSLYLENYTPLIYGGQMLVVIVAEIYLLNTRQNPTMKLTWCILVAAVPIFGILLYLLNRLDLGHRASRYVQRVVMRETVRYIPDQSELMASLEREDKALHNLANYTRSCGWPVYSGSTVKYFPDGETKLTELIYQLKRAEKYIFLEYFIIEEGYMWGSVLKVLLRKARAGVDVRVMYDGTCSFTRLPRSYPSKLEELGIKCKVFAPIYPFVSTSYNNRDHRKIVVIDGETAFTGGINLADEYVNRKQPYGKWKDTAVMVQGDAVQSFTRMFLQLWNASERERVYEPYLHPAPPVKGAAGCVIPYVDSPLDSEQTAELVYLDIINRAQDYLYIMTPYLILDNELVTALGYCARRGVDTRIILPHIPDKKYAFLLAKTHYRELMDAGIKIYEYTPGFVHAKMFICDDREAVVGTVNLDYRSLYLHFECGLYMKEVPALQDIWQDFSDTMDESHLVTVADLKAEKRINKLFAWLLKVVAPLM